MGELEKYGFLSLTLLIVLFLVLSFIGPGIVEPEAGMESSAGLQVEVVESSAPPARALVRPESAGTPNVVRLVIRGDDVVPDPAGGSSSTEGGPSAATSTRRTHTIRKGDTFEKLAKHYLGRRRDWPLFAEWNPKVDPKKLMPGDVVRVPPLPDRSKKTSPAAAVPTGSRPDQEKPVRQKTNERPRPKAPTHTIAKDDTLSAISLEYYGKATLWRQIWEANRDKIPDPAKLKPGIVLKLP